MAGNIQWFRWHHGSVTDPKFKLIAHKAKQSLATVIAVWAFLLEQASASDERGAFGDVDCESLDCLLGLEDGATSAIVLSMEGRGLVADGSVSAWEKRQPKRERVDENSTERSRAFRHKQRQETPGIVNATPQSSDETPCNATQRQETPREEKRREEKKEEKKEEAQAPLPDWLPLEAWTGYAEMRKRIRKPMTARAQKLVLSALKDMQAKGLSVAQALDNSTRNSWVDVYEPKDAAGSGGAPRRGSDAYAAAHKSADWWREAGFASVWDADANKCWHDNAHQFRDGKRVQVTA